MTLYKGDCLNELKKIDDNSIDLVYLDPPFFTQRIHKLKTRDNSKEYEFTDTWNSLDEYLLFMKERLKECHRVLKKTGSIFLHCDKSASHYLRVLLDQVFGINNFRNEIIWSYKRWSNSKRSLQNSHQNIYFYSKTSEYKFNTIYTDYSPTTNIDQILQERERDRNGKAVYKKDEFGNVVMCKNKKGVPLSDVWEIPFLNPKADERTGYPTQKPILLLERIIRICTDVGDTVLDPFCGSGTTLVAAKLLNRNYIGIDISEEAITLAKQRLENPIKTKSYLLEKGEAEYINKNEYEMAILKCLDAFPVQRNSGIDGFLKYDYRGKPIAVRIQKDGEQLSLAANKLLTASRKKGCKLSILIRTRNELTFFDFEKPDDLIIIDSYDLVIKDYIDKNQH